MVQHLLCTVISKYISCTIVCLVYLCSNSQPSSGWPCPLASLLSSRVPSGLDLFTSALLVSHDHRHIHPNTLQGPWTNLVFWFELIRLIYVLRLIWNSMRCYTALYFHLWNLKTEPQKLKVEKLDCIQHWVHGIEIPLFCYIINSQIMENKNCLLTWSIPIIIPYDAILRTNRWSITIDFPLGILAKLLDGLPWASWCIMQQHPLLSCGQSGSIILLLKAHLHNFTTACQSKVNRSNFTTGHVIW